MGVLRSTAGLWAIGATLIGVVIGVATLNIRAQYQAAIDNQRRGLTQLSRVLAEDTSRYIKVVDLVLREVQSRLLDQNIVTEERIRRDLRGETTSEMLRALVRDLPQASSIGLVDADGKLLNLSLEMPSGAFDVRDRDYFQYLSTHDDPVPYFGEVQEGRVTHAPTLFLARRINGPHNEFLGLVVAALNVAYLTGHFQAVLSQEGEAITLLRGDGVVLTRYPRGDSARGRRMPPESPWYATLASGGGTYISPGYLFSERLIVAVSPVTDYHLVIDATMNLSEALAEWRERAFVMAAAVAAAIIGIIALFAVIATQFRRLQRAAEALRASERRIRDFAQTASDWFWEQDENLRFNWISRESPIVQQDDNSYIGELRWERAGADLTDPAWAGHKADLEARRSFRDFRYQRPGHDGKVHHISISGNPIYDDAGTFLGYRGSGRDVTAAVEAEAELRYAKEQAEAASRAKSEFLATMTHELRTPLNAIIGFAGLIRDQRNDPGGTRHTEYAKEISDGGKHLLGVINDVLDMSRIEAGSYDLNDRPLDLIDLLKTCCATLASRAEEAGVRLVCGPEPHGEPSDERDAPPPGVTLSEMLVRADRRAMRQVVLNVLANAVKFTPPGGTVNAGLDIAADGGVAIVVTDTGIGMDEAVLRHLFQPFHQADGSITRRFGGTGLGLAISRRLMELHGGTLEVGSTPGKGTTVRIGLPRARVLGVPNGTDLAVSSISGLNH